MACELSHYVQLMLGTFLAGTVVDIRSVGLQPPRQARNTSCCVIGEHAGACAPLLIVHLDLCTLNPPWTCTSPRHMHGTRERAALPITVDTRCDQQVHAGGGPACLKQLPRHHAVREHVVAQVGAIHVDQVEQDLQGAGQCWFSAPWRKMHARHAALSPTDA